MSVLEVKDILASLVDKYEFEPRDADLRIVSLLPPFYNHQRLIASDLSQKRQSNIVTRPVIVGEEEKGYQLPLRVRKAVR